MPVSLTYLRVCSQVLEFFFVKFCLLFLYVESQTFIGKSCALKLVRKILIKKLTI